MPVPNRKVQAPKGHTSKVLVKGPVKTDASKRKSAPLTKGTLPKSKKKGASAPIRTKPPAKPKGAFRVRDISPGEVAALILEDLSQNFGDVCNFFTEAALARKGELFLAFVSLQEKVERITEVSARNVWVKSQALASLKKSCDPDYDRWPDTIKTWTSTEHHCKRINQRFTAWKARARRGEKSLPYESEIRRMAQLCHYVLGETPPLDDILQQAHYGPGSTVGVSGSAVHYVAKKGALDCTRRAVELAARSLVYDKGMWEQLGHDPIYDHVESARLGFVRDATAAILSELVSHDKLMFIHKGLTSLRSIGAQPTMNGMLQLGIDPIVRRLLAERLGIDLQDQSLNQRLAYEGSRHWTDDDPWCTTDQSNASNNIALVLTGLYPDAWRDLFLKTRTTHYLAPEQLGGGVHEYHMYAGMGNGTTFVLETLLFAAAAFATSQLPLEEFVSRRQFAIYGDDVVLRRAHTERFIPFAQYMGFVINRSKTFLEGPFRESCGADYWAGVNVRPAYVKCEEPIMHELELIGIHNTLVDHPHWQLHQAARGIRKLFADRVSKIIPTDPAGGLGFRPVGTKAGYTIVRKDDKPVISSVWHRPRYFTYNVRARLDKLGEIGPWTQLAVALNRGTQLWSTKEKAPWSLPLRQLVNTRLVAEEDLQRKDLNLMLLNQLKRLAIRKASTWWNNYQGV